MAPVLNTFIFQLLECRGEGYQRCNKEASLTVCLVVVTAIAAHGSQFRYDVMTEGKSEKKKKKKITNPYRSLVKI